MASFSDMMKLARARYKRKGLHGESKRFAEIIAILGKHELKDGISPESAVAVLQDLGPTFVKLGQIASTHPDVLPPEYCAALGALRTNVSPMDIETVKSQVESELGKPVEELFLNFDEKAVGSASIAQVHRATLLDGTTVAVKVQRPGIVETVTNDLAILEWFAGTYELFASKGNTISLADLVDEMVRTSTSELDFTNEANNLDRFWHNNQGRAGIRSPRCYRDYSTPAILVEDFADAPCVEKIDSLNLSEEERERLAYLIAQNYMQQIMEDGFYHADPHAGNILVFGGSGIEWIDFGMMGSITSAERSVMKDVISSITKGDAYAFKRSLLKLATPVGPVDQSELLVICEDVMDRFVNTDLESFDTAELMGTLIETMQNHGMRVQPFLTNLARGLVTLEGTIHLISPKLNIVKVLEDYMTSSVSLKDVVKGGRKFVGRSVDSLSALADLPSKAVDTLDMVQKGQVRVALNMMNDDLDREIRGVGAIIALSFIAAALVVGACILGASGNGIYIGGVSLEGSFGLIVGAAMLIFVYVKSRNYLK